jgi:hypothetical protein
VTPDDHLSLRERVAVALALTAFFLTGYCMVGVVAPAERLYDMSAPVDFSIPFSAPTAWIYIWALPAATMPAFIISSRRLFRSTALAYALAISISLALFALFPATAKALRPSTLGLDLRRPSEWLVANIYSIDPPGNLFPSLHLSMTALSALASWRASRLFGSLGFIGLAGVAASACTVKQHFVADVASGLCLALAIWAFTIRRCPGQDAGARDEITRRGAVFLLFAGCFYAVVGAAFLMGVRVHRCPDVTGACLANAQPRAAGVRLV